MKKCIGQPKPQRICFEWQDDDAYKYVEVGICPKPCHNL